MSNIIMSKPIPIPQQNIYVKSLYGFDVPPYGGSTFIFELILTYKNSQKKYFRKIENKKYSHLIDISDNIKYIDIKNFNLSIRKIIDNRTHKMSAEITHDIDYFNKNDNDIYIEFTKNNLGNTICMCYFMGIDFSSMSISPPN